MNPRRSLANVAIRLPSAVLLAVLLGCLLASGARAQSLEELLGGVMANHDRIIAAQADVEAAKNKARVALGAWFPVLDQTANYGFEKQQKAAADNTSVAFQEYDLN